MKSLRNYFKDNLTAYSYLFFAQVIIAATNTYLGFTLKHPPKYGNDLITSLLLLEMVVFLFVTPFIFIVGFLATFNYPNDKAGKLILMLVNLLLILIVAISALTT